MTDFEVMVLFLIGCVLGWFLVCGLMEYIIWLKEKRRAATERLARLEKENEVLRKELKYQQHINEVMILCRPFIK